MRRETLDTFFSLITFSFDGNFLDSKRSLQKFASGGHSLTRKIDLELDTIYFGYLMFLFQGGRSETNWQDLIAYVHDTFMMFPNRYGNKQLQLTIAIGDLDKRQEFPPDIGKAGLVYHFLSAMRAMLGPLGQLQGELEAFHFLPVWHRQFEALIETTILDAGSNYKAERESSFKPRHLSASHETCEEEGPPEFDRSEGAKHAGEERNTRGWAMEEIARRFEYFGSCVGLNWISKGVVSYFLKVWGIYSRMNWDSIDSYHSNIMTLHLNVLVFNQNVLRSLERVMWASFV